MYISYCNFFQLISSYYYLSYVLFVHQFKFVRMHVYVCVCTREYKYIYIIVKQRISLVFDINHIFYIISITRKNYLHMAFLPLHTM